MTKGTEKSELWRKKETLPEGPGVYLFKDARGKVLYVGKAANLRHRVSSYFQSRHDGNPWLSTLMDRARDLEVLTTRSEKEALILECNLIKIHRPPFNIRFRDDKSYPFLKLDLKEPFPTLYITRQPKEDDALYFGPFPDGLALKETLEIIKKLFGVRTMKIINDKRRSGCPWRDTKKPLPRACLEFHLLRCSGPCIGAISPEEYARQCRRLAQFLNGRAKDVLKRLEEEMWAAAQREDFETAAARRDQLNALIRVTQRQAVHLSIKGDVDAYAFAGQMGLGCVQMILVRSGQVIADPHFIVHYQDGQSPSQILGAFLKQRYAAGVTVPQTILLPVELEDRPVLEQWLTEKRGAPVRIVFGKKAHFKDLLELAETNAQQALREEIHREEQERLARSYALLSLQTLLHLPAPPERIECFDISTTMGTESVGAMVVFEGGKPAKAHYRKFRIKNPRKGEKGLPIPDDYAAMEEVLRRRFRHYEEGDPKFSTLPDLLLIDGGKGQLTVALKVLKDLNLSLPVAALAKEQELLFVPTSPEPIAFPFHSPALHLLQRIRDEAHRLAVGFHRKRRQQKTLRTLLDEVPGIGPARRKALLHHFRSLDDLANASPEELAKVPHMTRKVAQSLWQFLRSGWRDRWAGEPAEGVGGTP
ncbi:MAG: excinuclease ABC subunit UvrC [Armatimonadetes bacterium]|nr:excinuclease ABC subunit UvrC [Armatimonadota bacterium]MDW8121954.1 excinuclease ABC subunit UvrC [Armatimonadota bacterium]